MQDLLASALAPRSVAVIGASENIHKIGGRPIHYMQRHGFQGAIYPINPAREKIQGHRSYASLAALPEAPDLAVIALGGDRTVAAVEECAARGVKGAVVIASGFGETGPAGRELQDHMVARARAAGMRLYGPNTQGLANFGTGAIAGFSTMFIEVPPQDGPVGIVSQSGGMSSMVYGLLRGRGLGVRHVHATGNEADVTVAEMAWAVAHDPDVKLLLLYLENIARPDMLAAAAAYARERDLPIVAVKAGRTAGGQKAASSHTGALANEDRAVDAFLKHHGIWRVRDPHEQARAAQAYLKGWRPEGRRLVVISNSGASCVMGADAADDAGLTLAPLSEATQAAVASKLPGFATASNPIDVTAALLSNSGLFGDVLPAVAQDPAADLFFLNIPVAGAGYDVDRFARDAAAFEAATAKPVAVAAWQESVAAPFRAHGIATFPNEGEAIAVLAQVASHTALMRAPRTAWPDLPDVQVPAGAQGFLNEVDSLGLLARHGVPTVPLRLCRTADEARAAFDAIGAPAVVKACSADVPHKSEHGLVALNVQTREQAAELFERFWAKMDAMGVQRDGVIVAATRKARREFMVGARMDPVFGPVVVVGDGGKYVEALKDCAVLLPPFSEQDVQAALCTLRIAPLLGGVRGEPPLDVQALSRIAVAAGRVIAGARGAIASLDLNPVMVGAAGKGAVVVDALVEVSKP
ncbi:pimeloyl-CoA synthetase [Alicycliphilus denitrificans]|uniref:acetate--CoA ligase family protein n=1 Tax=Alicycliphilus denitrificans TaxID=179636 RepID=UPI0019156E16|nr:acetate--CoA ligase family protein [Alicycliphilus denitrificans]MBN9574398.1 acetate--CoA ligase family protein [Alicycliphilus denitrificans]BCN41078.1 pimeloyl-CoA synthetase [Alicycliphilus denitrificans]